MIELVEVSTSGKLATIYIVNVPALAPETVNCLVVPEAGTVN